MHKCVSMKCQMKGKGPSLPLPQNTLLWAGRGHFFLLVVICKKIFFWSLAVKKTLSHALPIKYCSKRRPRYYGQYLFSLVSHLYWPARTEDDMEHLHPQLLVASECSDHGIVSHRVLLLVVIETISWHRQNSVFIKPERSEKKGRHMYLGGRSFYSSLHFSKWLKISFQVEQAH